MSRLQKAIQSVRRAINPQTAKSYGNWGGWQLGGTYGANDDLRPDKWGAALAAVSNVPAYRCIIKRVETVGATRWQILSNRDDSVLASSDDTTSSDNPLAAALERYEKRRMMSLFAAWELSECIAGETFVEYVRNDYGIISDLEWLNPLGMSILSTSNIITGYQFSGFGLSVAYTPKELLYARNPLDLRSLVYGHSPLMTAIGSQALDVSRNSARVMAAFFRNDASPAWIGTPAGAFASTGWSEAQTASIANAISNQHRGSANKYRAAVFPFPMEVTQLPLPELDKWATLLRDIEPQIYTAFGVPRSVAGDSDSTRYQASPDDVPNFYATIVSRLRAIETSVNAGIVPRFTYGGLDYRFAFDYSSFNVLKQEAVAPYSQLYSDGVITLNEYRKNVGLDDVPNGDVLLMQSSAVLMPLDRIGAPLPAVNTPAPTALPETVETPQDAPVAALVRAAPEKYAHIDFTPTGAMKDDAKRGLAWRREFGRGGTGVGIARARDIINDVELSPQTVRRMKAYFDRHEVDKQGQGWSQGEDGYPSNGRIAWALWGGDAGYAWARKRVEQMNAADESKRAPLPVADKPDTDTDAALSELKAWRKFTANRKSASRDFVTHALPDYVVSAIKRGLCDGDTGVWRRYEAVLTGDVSHIALPADSVAYRVHLEASGVKGDTLENAVKAHALGLLAAKAIQATVIDFELIVEDLFQDAVDGNVTKRRFKLILMNAIAVACRKAFTDGYRDGGVIVELQDLEEEELDWLDTWIASQREYVNNVADAIYVDERVTPQEAANKPEMWTNKSIIPAYQKGVSFASQNGVFEWVLGVAEHCTSCTRLSGQRRRMKFWDANVRPKSSELECEGFRCACNLAPTREKVSRGRLPNWRVAKSCDIGGHDHAHMETASD